MQSLTRSCRYLHDVCEASNVSLSPFPSPYWVREDSLYWLVVLAGTAQQVSKWIFRDDPVVNNAKDFYYKCETMSEAATILRATDESFCSASAVNRMRILRSIPLYRECDRLCYGADDLLDVAQLIVRLTINELQ